MNMYQYLQITLYINNPLSIRWKTFCLLFGFRFGIVMSRKNMNKTYIRKFAYMLYNAYKNIQPLLIGLFATQIRHCYTKCN